MAQRESTSDEERAAYHEAGHAVIAHICSKFGGRRVVSVSIVQDEDSDGRIAVGEPTREMKPEDMSFLTIMNIFGSLGGIAAEDIAFGGFEQYGSDSDLGFALESAQRLKPIGEEAKEPEALIVDLFEDAIKLLKQNWSAVEALAKYLLANKECDAEMTAHIIEVNR